MSDLKRLTELEKRRYMKTFRELLNLCKDSPFEAVMLILEHANTPQVDPYTDEAAAYFLLGSLYGACATHVIGIDKVLNDATKSHEYFDDLKPDDFLGTRRKKGKLYP